MKETKNNYIILCLYVDDIFIIRNNDKIIESTKDILSSRFDMDIGLADIILGIKIPKTLEGLVLS